MIPARGSRRLLLVGFVAIVALFLLSRLGATAVSRYVMHKNHAIVSDMLERIELVWRMSRDLERERILIDTHIFERETTDMTLTERRIAQVRGDFVTAAQAYAQLDKRPEEERIWDTFESRVAATTQPVDRVIALSRVNRDTEARAAMVTLEVEFAEIERDAGQLLKQSHLGAETAMQEVNARQGFGMMVSTGLGLVGAVFAGVIGIWVTRLVRRREETIEQGARQLEGRNRELDAFAGRVAHDLRGPMTTIALAASRMQAPDEQTTRKVLARGVERMERLITDLLSLARVDSQVGGVSDPALVAQQIGEELMPQVEGDHGTLRVEVAPAAVDCAEGLLRQILWNVAENALKYQREGVAPCIEIRGRPAGAGYDLRICDNGRGMSPEDARHAFEPFFRAQAVRSQPGTGLGLSIVKRIVDAIRGQVCVDSNLGKGTTVAIYLQLAKSTKSAKGE